MTLRPKRRKQRDRDAISGDTVKDCFLGPGAGPDAVFSCLSRNRQDKPPIGANGKRRIGVLGGDSTFGCTGSSDGMSASAGEDGTFMIGASPGGDENK